MEQEKALSAFGFIARKLLQVWRILTFIERTGPQLRN